MKCFKCGRELKAGERCYSPVLNPFVVECKQCHENHSPLVKMLYSSKVVE